MDHLLHIKDGIFMIIKIFEFWWFIMVIMVWSSSGLWAENNVIEDFPVETLVLKPMNLTTLSIRVPAAVAGPELNWSCRPLKNCSYSCSVPAFVIHEKDHECGDGVARLLAEYAATFCEEKVPLTIFTGWKWDFFYEMCDFNSIAYEVPGHSSWEAGFQTIFTQIAGHLRYEWLTIPWAENTATSTNRSLAQSTIEVTTYTSLGIRDGYPKTRTLSK
jgi:hypothetical protein